MGIESAQDSLEGGPHPAAVVREAAEAHGFNYGTLRRAFRALDGKATRQENGERGWLWGLARVVQTSAS